MPETEKNKIIQKAKKDVNKSIKEEMLALWNQKVQKLTFQGDFASLLLKKRQM